MDRNPRQIRRFDSLPSCCEALALAILRHLQQVIARQGFASWVLPGGRTPMPLFSVLVQRQAEIPLDWGRVAFFFGDERCLALGHPDSNFAMAHRYLLAELPIDSAQVFAMPVMDLPPEAAARRYRQTIADWFRERTGWREDDASSVPPSFDLVLLGMGEDGHTASLFPDHPVLDCREWVVAVEAPGQAMPPVPRLSLTLELLNAADTVFFLLNGPAKLQLAETLLGQPPQRRYPASLVRPRRQLVWYLAP